jgi:hypothetical protein
MRKELFVLPLLAAVVIISGCTGSPAPGTSVDLTGKDYDAIVALGIPVTCHISKVGNVATDVTAHMKGQNIAAEMTFEVDGKSYTAQSVVKDKIVYAKVNEELFGNLSTDCEWISINASDESTNTPTITPEGLKALADTDLTCQVASFGDERFATNGKVCTFKEFMKSVMPDFSDQDTDYCQYITDPEDRTNLGCD